jgi:hypothetical protein
MKNYLLDTNILIYYFNGEMEENVKNKVSELMRESFQISVISKMEFLGFPFNSQEREQAIKSKNSFKLSRHPLSYLIKIIKNQQTGKNNDEKMATECRFSSTRNDTYRAGGNSFRDFRKRQCDCSR